MTDPLSTTSKYPRLQSISSKLWPWLVFASVGIIIAQVMASPAYAWWFTPTSPTSSVSPVHQQGLVVSPLASALIPQFILQPLSQTIVEQPAVVAATPAPTSVPTVTPSAIKKTLLVTPIALPPTSVSFSAMAQRILQLVNEQRAANSLPAMALDASLSASAQAYAEYMSSGHFFSHTGLDGSKFTQRDQAAGYTGWSWLEENIAYGQSSADMVMSDWMESPEHRANILNPHVKDLGFGMAGTSPIYWDQEFGAR
jgi:uncharacterized protein YkwD